MNMSHDLYIEVTDKDKKVSYHYHRVWDAEKFVASLQDQHRKEGSTIRVTSVQEYVANKRTKV